MDRTVFTDIKKDVQEADFYWTDKDQLPSDWTQGAFLGNGTLGIMAYFVKKKEDYYLHIELGNNRVYDRRPSRDFWMAKQFDNPRLPIGYLEYPVGSAEEVADIDTRFVMHTSLYEGCTDVRVKTKRLEMACRIYVCAEDPIIVIEQKYGDICNWKFTAEEAVSPRQSFGILNKADDRTDFNYRRNALPEIKESRNQEGIGEVVCTQELDGEYRTVTVVQYDGDAQKIYITTDQSKNLKESSVRGQLNEVRGTNFEEKHLKWWEKYYTISGLKIPDERLQQFYWRQMFKLGCAVHRESPALDNQGPWLSVTPWPGNWWNLNVQLSYWPLYTAGRLEQAESLNRHLEYFQEDLIENVPLEYRYDSSGMGTNTTWNMKSKIADPLRDNGKQFVELGNLIWILHDCWLYYQMTMDREMLGGFLYPLLKRSVNYYLHFIKKEEDGKWHLPPTDSPEYGEKCADCNYDLSLLKWGCKTLLKAAEVLHITEEKVEIWKDICENLVDYAINETGYMIGKDLPYAKSHRHFSHLMMHIPLYLVNRENSDSWGLVEQSIQHWFSYQGDILGFSYVGASLLCSAYKKGSKALKYIEELLDTQITENSMYREAGAVIETPLAASECIQQFLLQSWGGKIRVFPAMPDEWQESSFFGFAAQGGFRVSASYEQGKTKWVEIHSLAGEACVLETDMKAVRLIYSDGRMEEKEPASDCEILLKAGETLRVERV